MTPSRIDTYDATSTAHALALLGEYTHTLDSLPLDLSRHFADLRELDAVLSASMSALTSKIHTLTLMLENSRSSSSSSSVPVPSKEERLWLLTEIADEAVRLKLGGEDKIRVACQAADNLRHCAGHLKVLTETLPGVDARSVALGRKTVYPHVAPKSYMPVVTAETGRRRRGGYGSLLTSANVQPETSPAKKRQRQTREDEFADSVVNRSPRKQLVDKAQDGRPRARNNKKNDRAPSPSESLVSVTSHVQQPSNGSNLYRSNGNSNSNNGAGHSRNGNNNSAPVSSNNKRSRPSNNNGHNNRSATPNMSDTYDATYLNNNKSRRQENVYPPPPPGNSHHPSLPISYHHQSGTPPVGTNGGVSSNGGHVPPHHASSYDLHVPPSSIVGAHDWSPPLAQHLEGPGMPVSRGHTVVPLVPININATSNSVVGGPGIPPPQGMIVDGVPEGDGGVEGDGDGDGDDKTYCICNGVSYGEMIACDDAQCEREWFHLTCINLAVPPEGRWFCDACRSRRNAKRSGRGGKRRAGGGGGGGRSGTRAA